MSLEHRQWCRQTNPDSSSHLEGHDHPLQDACPREWCNPQWPISTTLLTRSIPHISCLPRGILCIFGLSHFDLTCHQLLQCLSHLVCCSLDLLFQGPLQVMLIIVKVLPIMSEGTRSLNWDWMILPCCWPWWWIALVNCRGKPMGIQVPTWTWPATDPYPPTQGYIAPKGTLRGPKGIPTTGLPQEGTYIACVLVLATKIVIYISIASQPSGSSISVGSVLASTAFTSSNVVTFRTSESLTKPKWLQLPRHCYGCPTLFPSSLPFSEQPHRCMTCVPLLSMLAVPTYAYLCVPVSGCACGSQ